MPDFDNFFCSTIYDRVCHWLTVGRWVSPGTPVSSTKKADRHDITAVPDLGQMRPCAT
jgi:hypothetical protein